MQGVPEDIEPEEKPTLETVAEESKQKQGDANSKLRSEIVEMARDLWGDDCILRLAALMRAHNTAISDASLDILKTVMDELDAKLTERNESQKQ